LALVDAPARLARPERDAENTRRFCTRCDVRGGERSLFFMIGTGRSAAFRRDLDQANLALLERSLAGRLLAYDYPLTPQGGPR
jgi:hypothetical protein